MMNATNRKGELPMPDTLKTYTVLFARDIPQYATAEIEARGDEDALAAAKALHDTEALNFTDPAWDDPVCCRIIHIEHPDGTEIVQDINLDRFRLIGPDRQALVDTAEELLLGLKQAIRALNNTPSFDTGIIDQSHPRRTITSYKLLPALESIVRKCGHEPHDFTANGGSDNAHG
jgi:hypothetical protein